MYLTLLILDIVVFYEECFCILTVHHCSTHGDKSQVLFVKISKIRTLQIENREFSSKSGLNMIRYDYVWVWRSW